MFQSDITNANLDEFIFFSLEPDDTYNMELIGQTQFYCWEDFCLFPQVKGI